jgi:hypothetical protein
MIVEDYWDERYQKGGNSGYGSYGEQLEKKLGWLSGLDIKSISEIGCGDFNFGSSLLKMYPEVKYLGQDVSSVIIGQNQEKYPGITFTTSPSEVPPADLVLCVDVLFHLIEDEVYKQTLNRIENLWTKYLAVTAYEEDRPSPSPHLALRKFDYKRFGEPLIRETVEADGDLKFYLFKTGIDLSKVSCCLNTKEKEYPEEVLRDITRHPFAEILVNVGSNSPHGKYKMFERAKSDFIYYQDDDAICPIKEIAKLSKPGMINVAMAEAHMEAYKNRRMTMGLGWGSIFPKSILGNLKRYTDKYGEDELFRRDTEKILTELVYPQNRMLLHIQSLPRAMNPDRLSFQPEHYGNMAIIEERCRMLI